MKWKVSNLSCKYSVEIPSHLLVYWLTVKIIQLHYKKRNFRRKKLAFLFYSWVISLGFVNYFNVRIGDTTILMYSLVESPEILLYLYCHVVYLMGGFKNSACRTRKLL